MQQALYRKYRPQTFAEVVGQEPVRLALQNQVANDRIAHAYLLAGPKGTGKTSLARILAKAANCLDMKAGEPCNVCANCMAADNGALMDLIEIDAASNTGVDNVRELIANIYTAPIQGRFKIYIIDEAHMLSKAAFNALLKTLEEPPSHVIFVLATTEAEKLLPTILSRCQRFDLRPVSTVQMVERLAMIAQAEGVELAPDVLELIAGQSGGGLRDGVSLLERVMALGAEVTPAGLRQWFGWVTLAEVAELACELSAGRTREVLARIDEFVYSGIDMVRLAGVWAQVLRAVLAIQLGNATTAGLAESARQPVEQLAARLSMADVVWWLEQVMELPRDIKGAVIPVVPIELMAVRAGSRFGGEAATGAGPATPTSLATNSPDPEATSQQVVAKAAQPPAQPEEQPVSVAPVEMAESTPFEWSRLVAEVRRAKPTFAGTLNAASWEVVGDTLQINFGRKFHYEVAAQSANRQLLHEAMKAGGWSLQIGLGLDERATMAQVEVDSALVTKIFGEA